MRTLRRQMHAQGLYMEDGKVKIHEDECIFCKDCFGPCPSVNFARNEEFEQ